MNLATNAIDIIKKKIVGYKEIIPVVMFHSIGLEKSDWNAKHLSEPLKQFEEKIFYLKKRGFHFIFWKELYDYMSGRRKIKLPAIMLTFDDGYLDNWVFAFPILKKYGAKASIFVNPDFVDPSVELRPTIEDIWSKKLTEGMLSPIGFLNWNEMRFMEDSGLIDIQSHALTHTWYFCSPQIVDIYKKGSGRYPWMAWNASTAYKPYYMTKLQSDPIADNTPIYEYEKSLICHRYIPAHQIAEEFRNRVPEIEENINYRKRKILFELHDKILQKYRSQCRIETNDEYECRVFEELAESKNIIEDRLNKQVDFICWPGGGYNSTVLKHAKAAGYKAWTISSRDQGGFRNLPYTSPHAIKRIGSYSKREKFWGKQVDYPNGRDFFYSVKRHQKGTFYKHLGRLNKIGRWVRAGF
jgi:peptidoglycan/xylan/chitin deacetylase (PgdA/CDA1 family)